MTDLPPYVTAHALERARQRFRIEGPNELVEAYIDAEVRAAREAHRILNHKPKHWRLYGEKGRILAPSERFYFNADDDRAWIVKRTPTRDVVTTSLSRPGRVPRLARPAVGVRR